MSFEEFYRQVGEVNRDRPFSDMARKAWDAAVAECQKIAREVSAESQNGTELPPRLYCDEIARRIEGLK
jgi:hypothetical protein